MDDVLCGTWAKVSPDSRTNFHRVFTFERDGFHFQVTLNDFRAIHHQKSKFAN